MGLAKGGKIMNLKTRFDGIELENPLMPAAGPLVGDAEKMLWLEQEAGLGGIVSKTNGLSLIIIFIEEFSFKHSLTSTNIFLTNPLEKLSLAN